MTHTKPSQLKNATLIPHLSASVRRASGLVQTRLREVNSWIVANTYKVRQSLGSLCEWRHPSGKRYHACKARRMSPQRCNALHGYLCCIV